ncbi:MAG: hypothetical protein ACREOK_04655 [Gemmatimonadaceae bacterium]
MALKRIAAVLLALPLLHLNVARAAIACESHDEASADAQVDHEHGAHVSHGPGHEPLSQQAPITGDPDIAECCLALAACSLAFGTPGIQSLASSGLLQDDMPGVARRMPLSRISAPEPPPPKA